MKVARLYRFGDIRIEDMPVPSVGAGEALIQVKASGICSGDAMPWYIEKKAPLVLGHEPSGTVVAVGRDVEGFSPGDRVFVHHHAPCMACPFCQRGDHVQCPAWKRSRIVPGGLAEYILVPPLNLQHDTLKLPDAVSFEDATLVEPTACVVKSFQRSGIRPGDTVLVIGLGVMGMLHLLLASHYGAGRVLATDRVPFRLEAAKRLGAHRVIPAESGDSLREAVLSCTDGRGAQVVIVGPPRMEAVSAGLACLAPGGTLLLFAPTPPGEKLPLDIHDLYFKDIRIVTSYSCGPEDTREALRLIEQGRVRAEMLVTHRFPIEEAPRAYETVARAQDALKVLVIF